MWMKCGLTASILFVCTYAISVKRPDSITIVDEIPTSDDDNGESKTEYFTVHQQTKIVRRKRGAVDHVEFPNKLDFKLKFRDREIHMRLKRNPYMTSNIQLSDDNGPIQHDLGRKTGVYSDQETMTSVIVQCEDYTEHCTLRGSTAIDGNMWKISPELEASQLHKAVQSTKETTIRFANDAIPLPETSAVADTGSPSQSYNEPISMRRKRAIPTDCEIVECYAIVDESVWNFFLNTSGSNTTAAEEAIAAEYLALYTEADGHYENVTLRRNDSCIRLFLVGVHIQKNTSESWSFSSELDVGGAVLAFVDGIGGIVRCGLQVNGLRSANLSIDLGQCFTRKDIVFNEGSGTTYFKFYRNLGFLASVCRPDSVNRTASVIETIGDKVELLIAHEIGHGLGANHDTTEGCDDNDGFIMATQAVINSDASKLRNIWFFSNCSVERFNAHLAQYPACLRDNGFTEAEYDNFATQPLAGTLFNISYQCTVRFGEGSVPCDPTGQNRPFLPNMCDSGTFCTDPNNGSTCTGRNRPYDGTPCGAFGSYCLKGECIDLKDIGEACSVSSDCKGSNVECSGSPSTCRCPSDRYVNFTNGDCDIKKDLGSSCESGQCGPTNSVCDSTTTTCKCQEGFFDTDGATAGGNCTAKLALGVACTQSDSCSDSNANCSGTCQCPSDFFDDNGTCEHKRCVGESCTNTTECEGVGVECLGSPATCKCPVGTYLNDTTGDCDTNKDLGSSCEPGQCGPTNSVCDSTTTTCKCQEGFFDTDGATAGGSCSAKLALDAACTQSDSCSDPNAICSGTCQCPSDFFDNNGTCEHKKCVGESCTNTTECEGVGVECLGSPATCKCPVGTYLNDTTGDCETNKELGASCEPGQCKPAGSVCDFTTNTCKCQKGFFDTDGATAGGNCSAKLALGAACTQSDSCSDPNAICSGTCQCPSDFFDNGGSCEHKKCVGESCTNTTECEGVGVECLGSPATCKCPIGTYLNDTTGNCDTNKDLGSSCEPGQCGPANSVCDSTTTTCKCQQGFFDTDGATAGGNCTAKLALGVSCTQSDSCSDPNAICSGICQCPSDFFDDSGSCEHKKCVGESCTNTTECEGVGVECLGSPATCKCPVGTYLNDTTGDCDINKDLGSSCEPGQCGPANSFCDSTTTTCKCQEGFFDTDGTTAGGNCTTKLALGVSCTQFDSCSDPNAICSGTCQCPSDFFDKRGSCEHKKCVGESCTNTTECEGVGVECLGSPATCKCPVGTYLNDTTGNCDTNKDLGSTCEPGQCGPANSVCDSTTNTCRCQEGFFDTDGATAGGNCSAKLALDAACTQSDSCSDPNAICSGTCQCPSDFFDNGGSCEHKKCVGESCTNTTECEGVGVECLGSPATCKCPVGTYLNDTTGDCDTSKDLGSSCEPGQCVPANSVCDSITTACKCQEGFFDTNGATAGGSCSAKIALDAACTQSDSCSDPNAICTGTCQCPSDFFDDSGSCEHKKCVGESCTNSTECEGVGVECLGSPPTCKCPTGTYLNDSTGNCDTNKDLGADCGHGQCGPAGSVCDFNTNTCRCQEGFFDTDGAIAGGSCSTKLALDAACTQPDSCSDPNAICSGTCQCPSDFFVDGGSCEHKKCVGESCTNTTECEGVGVECLGSPATCKCPIGTFLNDTTGDCDTNKDLGSSCEPGQCGPANSVCDSTTTTCKCQEGFFDTNGAPAGGSCSAKRALDASCTQSDSCSDPNAVCTGTCQCPSDFFDDSGSCKHKKCVGESCTNSTECEGVGVECLGSPATCKCPIGTYLNDTTGDCDTNKDLGSSCEPGQCGPANSVCDSTTTTCKCQEAFFDTNGATAGGSCSTKLALDAACTQPDSCLDPNAICSGTCQCPSDFFDNSGSCEHRKCVGESCTNTTECEGVGVECLGSPPTCKCPVGTYLNDTTGDCNTNKDLGSSCDPGQCGPANSVCDSTTTTCKCQEGFFDTNGATAVGSCSAKLALDASCTQSDSCSDPNAICSGTCQCPSDFYDDSGSCKHKKCVGESCTNSTECEGVGVECLGSPATCKCPTGTYLNVSTGDCETNKDLGSSCEPGQCGPANSVCDSTTTTCKCQEAFFDTNGATAGGSCSAKLALDSSCTQSDSCVDPNAICTGTCQCPADFFDDSGSCMHKKCVGESCSNSTECEGVGVECLGSPATCKCPVGTYLNVSTGDCETNKDLGDSCEPGQCGPAGSVCDFNTNTCKCQEGFFDTDGSTAGGSCSTKLALDAACTQPDSCSDPNAICSGTCQCPSDFFVDGGSCEHKKCVGESCSNTTECEGVGVVCLGSPATCKCPDGTYLNDTTGDCDTNKDLGSSCEPGQCGPANSVCNSITSTCKCQEDFFDTNGVTTGGSCSAKLALEASCTQSDSCLDPNAVCTGTCQCPLDFFVDSGSCEHKKCVGESCTNSTECEGVGVECLGSPATCKCPTGTYLNVSIGDCETNKDLGSSCEPGQCGPANSVCDSTTSTCKCQEGFFDTSAATAGGSCSAKLVLNASCTQSDSCSDPNAICTGTCQCPADFFDNGGSCEHKKCVGESCTNSTECEGVGVECLGSPATCKCPVGTYLNVSTGDCDTNKDLGDSCQPGQCGPSASVCDFNTNTCRCQEGFFDTDGSTAGGSCSTKLALDAACTQSDSCSDPNAICSGTCQCPSDFFVDGGSCEHKKCIGESCTNTTECEGTGVVCLGSPATCKCPVGTYLNDTTGDCDTNKDLGSSCEPGQCGPANSFCDSTTTTCKCQEGFFDANGATAGGSCSAKLALDASCTQSDSCSDPNAVCTGTCQCPSDFFDDSGSCVHKKCVGESCTNSTECEGVGVECLGSPATCKCPAGTYLNDTTGDCDTNKDLGSSCEPGQCGPANSVCVSTTTSCKCQEAFFDTNGVTVGGSCSTKLALDAACTQPDSCLDPNAICSGTCQCPSDFFDNSGSCEHKKCVGESCTNSTECEGVGVECLGSPPTCKCPVGTYLNDTTGDCDTNKDLGSSCEPGQCGPANSVCDSITTTCKCQVGFFDTNGAAAGGSCSAKLALGASCTQSDSCSDPNAICTGTCICPSDFFEDSGSCEHKKCVGESCTNSTECEGVGVECLGSPATCKCPAGTYLNDTTGDCDTNKDLGLSCEPGQCGPTNSVCESTTATCKCQEGFFDTDGATAGGSCSAKLALDASCTQSDSCSDPNAICTGTCQCPSDFFDDGGSCEHKKCVGESCTNSTECEGVGVECLGSPATCKCPVGTYLNDTTGDCDTNKDLGSICEPGQCGPAGSVCDFNTKTCRCQEGFFDTDGATAGGSCSTKLALDAACTQPDSCSDPNAICSGTCQCPSDFFDNGGSCEHKKCVGESCTNTTECEGVGVECLGSPATCKCPVGTYLNDTTGDCDTNKDLGSSCEPGQCGPANSVCDSTTTTCKCQEGFFDTDGATAGGSCSAKLALDVVCTQSDSCSDPNAICSGTCQCPSDFFDDNGSCEHKKCVGESCTNSTECEGVGVECLGSPATCKCPVGTYLNDTTGDCETNKDLGSSCEPGQCGPANSVCDSTTNICKCQEGFFDTDGATAGGSCSAKLALDVACTQSDSCLDPNAICSGTCQCPSDFFDDNGTCEHKKCVGESCTNTIECEGVGVECLGSPATCKCPDGTYLNDTTGNCDTKLALGATCSAGQCADENSVCHTLTGVCRCIEGYAANNSVCERDCPVGWERFSNSCYYFGTQELFYNPARALCDIYDSDLYSSNLVQIDTQAELDYVKAFMLNRDLQPRACYWNDLFQTTTNGNETWRTTGDPLVISDWWSLRRPDDNNGNTIEACTAFWKFQDYVQEDLQCANSITDGVDVRTCYALCKISLN